MLDLLDYFLWEMFGYVEKFGENMYLMVMLDEWKYVFKFMNCLGGVQVYNFGQCFY